MKSLKKSFICALVLSVLAACAVVAPTAAFAAGNTCYDVSEAVSKVGAHKQFEMKHGVKVTGEKKLDYGDSVKFAYKERSEENEYGHFSRTAFGIGSYGLYFYHSAGDIDVRTCNMQSEDKSWGRAKKGFTTIPDKAFKEYTEITVKAELKPNDASTVVFSLTYSGKTVSKEFAKDANSDMKFRFGDHDVDGNFVKSLAPKTDNEAPVITVAVSEFEVPVGAYPADDAFTVTDDSGECKVTVVWTAGAFDERGRLTAGTHVCTITATDDSDNVSTAKITYIVTEETVSSKYKITFKAEGKVVGETEYNEDTAEYLTLPAVPKKEHYQGKWKPFTPEMNDTQVVEAEYTPIKYLVVFVADKKIVSEQYYTVENVGVTEPEVPEKEGYTGEWEAYELNFKNIRVTAVYTEKTPDTPDKPDKPDVPDKPDNPDVPDKPDTPDNSQSGCRGSLSGTVFPAAVLCAAAVLAIFAKKKSDER